MSEPTVGQVQNAATYPLAMLSAWTLGDQDAGIAILDQAAEDDPLGAFAATTGLLLSTVLTLVDAGIIESVEAWIARTLEHVNDVDEETIQRGARLFGRE